MQHSQAIVTLAIGEKYVQQWKQLCEQNWRVYADQYGYDIICIDTPLDTSERAKKRSPAWQKCLILSQDFSQKYERIIWVDSDILINHAIAPNITQNVPLEKIGAVETWSGPTPELYAEALERMTQYCQILGYPTIANPQARDYYKNYGLPPDFDTVVQTGVMVFSPQHHREILEQVYNNYEEKPGGEWNYEMRPLSYELLKANLVHWIDYRFNNIWTTDKYLFYPFLLETKRNLFTKIKNKLPSFLKKSAKDEYLRYCVNTSFMNSYFLHFAGAAHEMKLVDLKTRSWQDLLS